MELVRQDIDDAVLITVNAKRIDAAAAIQFKDQMRALSKDAEGRIVLDLAQVGFVDSSGLGAIVGSMKQLTSNQTLELAALSTMVSKVFLLTRMDTIFMIHADVESAIPGQRKTG